jgi:hypothetical protein
MKQQFPGRWERRWLVTRTPQLVTPMLAFLKFTGVPVWQLALKRMVASFKN